MCTNGVHWAILHHQKKRKSRSLEMVESPFLPVPNVGRLSRMLRLTLPSRLRRDLRRADFLTFGAGTWPSLRLHVRRLFKIERGQAGSVTCWRVHPGCGESHLWSCGRGRGVLETRCERCTTRLCGASFFCRALCF
mmetsp:Transcript_26398/g.69390  ORF Transcript_26398/g.69390 Transcript_26398/m.69390 type:complete len:136 (-) Transcript_26398:123-530(-)